LSCAPINELGVVYLFGVLHEAFDFKIESIQAGFPTCIARRKIGRNRWEELSIDFQFKSKAFVRQNHDPDDIDIIICWKHNWKKCPEHIEIIELSSLIDSVETISQEVKQPRELSVYNKFCQEKRLKGLSFAEIAELWKSRKSSKKVTRQGKRPLSDWQKFCSEKKLEGKSFSEIGRLWREKKRQ